MAIVARYNGTGSRDNNRDSKVIISLTKSETRTLLGSFIKTLTRHELECILAETLTIENESQEKVSVSVSFDHEIKMTNFKETIVLQSGEAYPSEYEK